MRSTRRWVSIDIRLVSKAKKIFGMDFETRAKQTEAIKGMLQMQELSDKIVAADKAGVDDDTLQ
jgi:hypothetical protein